MLKEITCKLRQWIMFVELLHRLDDSTWYRPMDKGKWRIHDIVTHMMRWDVYFNEETFPAICNDSSAILQEHPDYLGYNEKSVE